jgi:hypothetical protein
LEEQRKAFLKAYTILDARIKLFLSLPLRTLDRMRLQERVTTIGKTVPSGDAL